MLKLPFIKITDKFNGKLSTALLTHYSQQASRLDGNKDGFMDLPLFNLVNVMNRWKYESDKWMVQWGGGYLGEQRVAGQMNFEEKTSNRYFVYGFGSATTRFESFAKIARLFQTKPWKGLGLILSAADHRNDSYFAFKQYVGREQSVFGNLIYQSIINSTIHKFRTGFSFQYDKYNEDYNLNSYVRKEIVPGTFFEYTYTPNDQWSLVAGIRGDNNNIYGSFITPRLNIRYEPVIGTVFRLSAGKGQRTANIFAENNSLFVSQRSLMIMGQNNSGAYSLNPEISWNKGISLDQKFNVFNNPATLSLDYFRNDFKNQVVVDIESAKKIHIYNLAGKSYSNSFQAEVNMTPFTKLDIRVAYRYFDVKQTYSGNLLDRPFIAKHRAFLSVDYATNNDWKFNYTVTFNGKKRIVNPYESYVSFIPPTSSPSYYLMNAQVSKSFGNNNLMDIYVGVENISNFFQQNTILSADDPFGPNFDASMIWGPVTGRMLYVGWRIKIK